MHKTLIGALTAGLTLLRPAAAPGPPLPVVGFPTGRSTIIPLTAGALVGLNGISPNAGGSVFAGGGLGVYFLNQHTNSTGALGRLGTSTREGAYGGLGYNITGFLFLDARYQFVNRADGLTAAAGLRF